MKIVITIEGGIIQDISHDDNLSEDIEVCIADYDTDGQDAPKITSFPDGGKEHCNLFKANIFRNEELVEHFFNELKKVEG